MYTKLWQMESMHICGNA